MKKIWYILIAIALTGCASTSNQSENNNYDIYTEINAVSGPTPIIKITPRYPRKAIEQKVSGEIRIEFLVGEDGKPTDINPLTDANEMLINEAINALMRNVYNPKYFGQKVVVDVVFHLTS